MQQHNFSLRTVVLNFRIYICLLPPLAKYFLVKHNLFTRYVRFQIVILSPNNPNIVFKFELFLVLLGHFCYGKSSDNFFWTHQKTITKTLCELDFKFQWAGMHDLVYKIKTSTSIHYTWIELWFWAMLRYTKIEQGSFKGTFLAFKIVLN